MKMKLLTNKRDPRNRIIVVDAHINGRRIVCDANSDDFVYGGYVDYIRRDATGCYVMMDDAWIPVVDWFDAHKFPGARDLTHLARYFYNLGRREAEEEKQ